MSAALQNEHFGFFCWKIQNFVTRMAGCHQGQHFDSEAFKNGGVDWFLRIFPKGQPSALVEPNPEESNQISLHLGRKVVSGNGGTIKAVIRFFVESNNNQPFNSTKISRRFPSQSSGECSLGVVCFYSLTSLMARSFTLIPEDVLTIWVEFSWSYEQLSVSSPPRVTLKTRPWNFEQFFNVESNFNDVIIEVNGEIIRVSSILLAQQSLVFQTMLQDNKFKEGTDRKIPISDLDGEVLKSVLKTVYSGIVPDLDLTLAEKWLVILDKYDFKTIRRKIEVGLIAQMTLSNVVGMLNLADTYAQLNELREEAIMFIRGSWPKINEHQYNYRNLSEYLKDEIAEGLRNSPIKRQFWS